jgi:hypothetical protein
MVPDLHLFTFAFTFVVTAHGMRRSFAGGTVQWDGTFMANGGNGHLVKSTTRPRLGGSKKNRKSPWVS